MKNEISKHFNIKCARTHKIYVVEHMNLTFVRKFSIFAFMERKYTIRDIAQMAGVSKGTVDRVLHKRGRVSESAFEKVNKILEEIDYRPNPIAKNLKNNKIYRLIVLLPDVIKDSYWLPCLKGIKEAEEEFKNFGIKIETSFFNAESTQSFSEKASEVIQTKPDAILMVPLFFKESQKIVANCDQAGIKVSVFNNFIDTSFINNFIGQDLFKSGRIAAKLIDTLIPNGHIGIIHIDENFQNATHLQEKEKGFKSYFQNSSNNNFHFSTINIKNENTEEFKRAINVFLDKNHDINGLFVTISKSYLVADAIKNRPKKIVLVGYDLVVNNLKHLKLGSIDFLIHQNPKQQVYMGLSFLAEYFLFDKQIPKQLLLPIDIVNSENYEEYIV